MFYGFTWKKQILLQEMVAKGEGGGVGMGSGTSPPFLYDPELQKKIVIELVQNLFLSRRLYGMKD